MDSVGYLALHGIPDIRQEIKYIVVLKFEDIFKDRQLVLLAVIGYLIPCVVGVDVALTAYKLTVDDYISSADALNGKLSEYGAVFGKCADQHRVGVGKI